MREIKEDNKYEVAAKRRCQIVIDNYPETWKGELLVRMSKLIKRDYQGHDQYRYDQAEIEQVRKLLGWNN